MGLLDRPDSGNLIIDNIDASKMKEKQAYKIRAKKIGFVFQMFNLLPRTSALANVELPLIYSGLTKKEREIKARQALSYLGLKERLTHFPSQLSGGEQQRVAIARALVTSPAMILADEPTGNVDSQSAREIMKIFKELNKEGNTIVVVTHDKQVAKYAKKIIKIHDGRIV